MQQQSPAVRREWWAGGAMIALGLGTAIHAASYNVGSLAPHGPHVPDDPGRAAGAAGRGHRAGRLRAAGGRRRGRGRRGAGLARLELHHRRTAGFIALGKFGGLVPATLALVFISALGDRQHTVKSAALLSAGVTLLGLAVFSWGLQLQFPLFRWGLIGHGNLQQPDARVLHRLRARQPDVGGLRRVHGQPDRRAARHGRAGRHLHSAAADLHHDADRGAGDAVGHLLRLAVWRRHHLHHAEPARHGSHAVACLDGNPLARNGKAGSALFMLMFSSFFGASIGILAMILFSPLLADVAFKFGPAEYFSMMMGLLAGATLAKGSAIKGVAMVVVGLLLGVVGTDVNTGVMRFHFGVLELSDGLQIVALAMGLFGVADFLKNINRLGGDAKVTAAKISMKSMRPEAGDIKQSRGALVRGGHRRGLRHPARHRADHRVLHLVCHRRRSRARPAPLRPWRHRGHRRARGRHQRVHADRLHPDHEPGHPWRSGHGADAGRAHHPRHPARTADDGRACRYVLGTDRQLLGRQHPAAVAEPAADRHVGAAADGAVPLPVPGGAVLRLRGRVQHQQQPVRRGMVTLFGVAGYALMRLRFEPAPLLLGFVLGPMVEENFRRALLPRGELSIFVAPHQPGLRGRLRAADLPADGLGGAAAAASGSVVAGLDGKPQRTPSRCGRLSDYVP